MQRYVNKSFAGVHLDKGVKVNIKGKHFELGNGRNTRGTSILSRISLKKKANAKITNSKKGGNNPSNLRRTTKDYRRDQNELIHSSIRRMENSNTDRVVVLIRNLPETFRTPRQLSELLPSDLEYSGMKVFSKLNQIDRGTAELYFYTRQSAETATSNQLP